MTLDTASTPPAAPEMSEQVRAELDDRYGRTRKWGRGAWIALGIVAVAAVGYFGVSTVTQSMNSVDVNNTAHQVPDAHSVRVEFQVTLQRGAAVTCALEAQDTDHGIVGWRIVSYPADDAHTRSFTETIPTVAEATTGLATACWIP